MGRQAADGAPPATSSALMRLHPEAERLLTPSLASGEQQRPAAAALRGLLEPFEDPVPLVALERALDEVIAASEPYDAAIDARCAPLLHAALPLSRRQACEPGIWRFLTVVHRPDFVRHRWENRSWQTMRSRFWSPGTRPDSNALCRLWWIAELTAHGDDYSLTRAALASQSLANSIFVRGFCHCHAAVQACVQVLGDAPADLIELVARRFNAALSTIPVEGQTPSHLAELLRGLRRTAEREVVPAARALAVPARVVSETEEVAPTVERPAAVEEAATAVARPVRVEEALTSAEQPATEEAAPELAVEQTPAAEEEPAAEQTPAVEKEPAAEQTHAVEEEPAEQAVDVASAVQEAIAPDGEQTLGAAIRRALVDDGEHLDDRVRQWILEAGEAAVPVLIDIVRDQALYAVDGPGEGWSPLHAIRLLGMVGAAAAAEPLLEVVAEADSLDVCYSAAIAALQQIGGPALEPTLRAYRAAGDDLEQRRALCDVLSGLGLDDRILAVLLDELDRQPPDAIAGMIGAYGDPRAIGPLSRLLDQQQVRKGDRLFANQGIIELADAIERLGGALTPPQQQLMARVKAQSALFRRMLDDRPDVVEPRRRVVRPGRNDPCWCGSGKKYKRCHLREDEGER